MSQSFQRTHCTHRTQRNDRRQGYTVLEVMMAISVLTLGALGVVAMQKATLFGNNNARKIATANAIALSWAERLRVEALEWNAAVATPNDLSTDTKWLLNTSNSGSAWFNPVLVNNGALTPAGSPTDDIIGADIIATDTSAAAYCTQMRLTTMLPYARLIRAEIRVYWARSGLPVTCSTAPDPASIVATLNRSTYGFVALTTAVVQNTAP